MRKSTFLTAAHDQEPTLNDNHGSVPSGNHHRQHRPAAALTVAKRRHTEGPGALAQPLVICDICGMQARAAKNARVSREALQGGREGELARSRPGGRCLLGTRRGSVDAPVLNLG